MSKKTKKRNKPYVPKNRKVVGKVPNWDELKTIGQLMMADIYNPHMVVTNVLETYQDLIKEDKELENVFTGLDKSYYDCVDKCLEIMGKHVESENFPKTHKDVIDRPEDFQNAVFKTGEVGKGIEDKDTAFQEMMTFQDINIQYQQLAHNLAALNVKGKTEAEMRLAAKYQTTKTKEEIQKENELLESQLAMASEVLGEVKNQVDNMKAVSELNTTLKEVIRKEEKVTEE